MPNSVGAFLWHFIKKQAGAFAFIVLTSLVWALNDAVFPYFMKLIINTIAHFNGQRETIFTPLFWPLTGLISLWCMMELSMRAQGMLMVYTMPEFRANIRRAVFHYIQGHSHTYFSNQLAGRIGNKLSELPKACERLIEDLIFSYISVGSGLIISMVMMSSASLLFTLITLTWMVLHISFTAWYLKTGYSIAEVYAESSSTLTGKMVDAVSNIFNVRLFSRTQYENSYLDKFQREEISSSKKADWHLEKMKIFLGLFGTVFVLTQLFMLIHQWIHNDISIGDFTLVMMISFNMLGFIWMLSFQSTIFVRDVGNVRSSLRLVSTEHEIIDMANAKPLSVSKGSIVFHDVTFSYGGASEVFHKLNVRIKPGEKIGLVGFSGAGKSSFVNLLLRFYDINSGEISIDGQNIKNVTQNSLRGSIAMIPQDPALFHRSLKDNIAYGRLDATDHEIIHAAKLAHCDEFITHLDNGYDTLVGERGVKLSGGQRQRIAIARAILKNAPILVLDEATSSLDSVTEKLIQESLATLMEKSTTLVIAHRLSTLKNMDRILVFDDGKIVEDGSMQELLSQGGHFATLWKSQHHGLLPE